MQIKYVALRRDECFTPERAAAQAKAEAEYEREMQETHNELPTTIKRMVVGSVLVTASYAALDAFSLTQLFRTQGARSEVDPEAMKLAQPGSSRRTAKNGFDAPLFESEEERPRKARHVGGSPLGSAA